MKQLLLILSLFLLSGCVRVNTNPAPLFEDVQQEVQTRTGQAVCWDTSSFEAYIEESLAQELTVENAISISLLNNRDLQATYETLGIAKAGLVQAGLLSNPIFALSYRFSTSSTVTDLIDSGLFQNFLEALLIPLKKRMASSEIEVTKATVTAQIFDVIAQTKIAFYTYQALEQMWNMKKCVLLGTESSYEAAQKLFDAGNIKALEVTARRIAYEQTKVDLATLEVEILHAREQLNVLMGLWGSQINWQTTACMPPIEEQELEWSQVESCAIAQSLDLDIARRRLCITAAGFGIDTTRIVFPQFDAGPNSERDEGVWFVGPALALSIPFFDFGQAMSAAAKAEIRRQWNAYTALAIEIRSAARIARARLLNAHRQALYYQKVLVPLAEQLTALILLQHNAMQLGVFELLATKLQELEQKIQAVEIAREYWVTHTELELLLNGHLMGRKAL